jgi:hypothetical protein
MAHPVTAVPLAPSLPPPPTLPRSWKLAAGLLAKHTRLHPLKFQKRLRGQWTGRLGKLDHRA